MSLVASLQEPVQLGGSLSTDMSKYVKHHLLFSRILGRGGILSFFPSSFPQQRISIVSVLEGPHVVTRLLCFPLVMAMSTWEEIPVLC